MDLPFTKILMIQKWKPHHLFATQWTDHKWIQFSLIPRPPLFLFIGFHSVYWVQTILNVNRRTKTGVGRSVIMIYTGMQDVTICKECTCKGEPMSGIEFRKQLGIVVDTKCSSYILLLIMVDYQQGARGIWLVATNKMIASHLKRDTISVKFACAFLKGNKL